MKSVVEKICRTLSDFHMIQPGEKILVGVSGGPDSVCLLHVLYRLSERLRICLAVAHFNHALRAERSGRDAAFASGLAQKFGLPYYEETVSPERQRAAGASPEEAARKARYAFFGRISTAYSYEKVALGHHAGDNAELYLMRLVTWSGPAGLSGIPPVREDLQSGKTIIRPLIRISRGEIISYLKHHGIAFMEDETNASTRFLRNRIRHHLIPELKSRYNPKIESALNRLCTITAADEQWMQSLAQTLFRQALTEAAKDHCSLSVEKVLEMPVAAQRRVLRIAIATVQGDLRRIAFHHVEAARRLLTRGSGADGKRLHLPGGVRLHYFKDRIVAFKRTDPLRGDDLSQS